MPHTPASDGRPPWRATVLTLFPEMFPGPLGVSLSGQALDAGLWLLETCQIRDFGLGKHRTVDDTPAGGGAGMVMRADVLAAALDHASAPGQKSSSPVAAHQQHHNEVHAGQGAAVQAARPLIYLSPRGQPLTENLSKSLAAGPGVVCLAGRFEGIDERVIHARGMREISIGDYVLSGGELAAMVLIDSCVRLLPGVLGAPESLAHESFENGLLEYPHYTKPREWEGHAIPDVLLSGDHKKIAAWREAQALALTKQRRPDLLRKP